MVEHIRQCHGATIQNQQRSGRMAQWLPSHIRLKPHHPIQIPRNPPKRTKLPTTKNKTISKSNQVKISKKIQEMYEMSQFKVQLFVNNKGLHYFEMIAKTIL